jgi:photosystem II stability/assembly factor-like uncharacterized protein
MMKTRKALNLSILIMVITLLCLALPGQEPWDTGTGPDGPALPDKGAGRAAEAAPLMETLFVEDFEAGLSAWNTDSNWTIVREGMNAVMQGDNHAWATLNQGENWTDYDLDVDVKIISGGAQLMLRLTGMRGRYIIGLTPGGIYLDREYPWEKIEKDLAVYSGAIPTNTWHHIRVETEAQQIEVFLDHSITPVISYKDTWGEALWQGSVGLEVIPGAGAQARFDNIGIYGVVPPEGDWIKTGGPIGGLGYDVRYGPSTQVMYVTDNYSGVNKSQDGGKTWFASNRGITGRFGASGDAVPVFTLTVDPNSFNIVWAGLKDDKGLYKSTNAGQTWNEVTPPITDPQFVFRGVTIQPGNSNIVYAQGELPMGKPGLVHDRVMGRIYRTEDGGVTWKMIWEGENLVRYVFIHPTNDQLLFASLGIFDREANDSICSRTPPFHGSGGVLKLEKQDSGWVSWFMNNGLTDMYVGTLAMHPVDPNIMLAGAGNTACSRFEQPAGVWNNTGGVFLTTDGGQSWTKTLANDIITAVEFSPNDPKMAYAGGQHKIYRSDNGGEDWTAISGLTYDWGPSGAPAGFPIDFLVEPGSSPGDPETIFTNNYGGGNVKSKDGGVTWLLASNGYTGALMLDVAINPQNPRIVYGGARSGIFRSTDGGATWQGLSTAPAQLPTTYGVAVKPDEPNVVLASQELLGQLYRSEDGGQSWTNVFTVPNVEPGVDLKQHGLKSIEFAAPPNSHVVYAGACRGSVALDDIMNNAKKLSEGIFKSTNGGVSWVDASDANTTDKCLTSIAIHPTNPNVVYASAPYAGVYKTVNGGTSWSLMPGLPTDMRSVAIHPANPSIVYAGALQGGVYRTVNGGVSWTPFKTGMEPNDPILALIIDPENPDVVWAGSRATGIYRWIPDEGRWTHVNSGLSTRSIQALAISPDGQLLYAATSGEGVFRNGELYSWHVMLPLIER